MNFVKGECSEKKQKAISCQVCDTSFHKRCTKMSRRNFNLALRNKENCYYQSCYIKNVPSSEVNESPTNDQNKSRNSHINIIITPNSNKSDSLLLQLHFYRSAF